MDSKFKVGDRASKPKGYEFPCTIVSVFKTTSGDIRVVGEMDHYKMLHIFNENQLEQESASIDTVDDHITVKELCEKYPNYYDLGWAVMKYYENNLKNE